MTKRHALIVAASLFLLASPAAAAEVREAVMKDLAPPAGRLDGAVTKRQEGLVSITLAEAHTLAARHNRSLIASRMQLAGAGSGLSAAQATNFPTLSAGVDGANAQPGSNLAGAFTLGYEIDTTGARGASIRLGEQQLKLSALDVDRSSLEIRYQVTTAYYEAQLAQEQVRIARVMLTSAEQSHNDVKAMRQAGEGTTFDLQRAGLQVAHAKQALNTANGAQLVESRQLARLLGLKPGAAVTAAEAPVPASAWPLTREASLTQAVSTRPDVVQWQVRKQMATEQERLALAALGLRTQVFAKSGTTNMAANGQSLFDGRTPGLDYTVGVTASMMLVDWGAARATAKQAEWNAVAADQQLSDSVLQVQMEVEQAFASMAAARENMTVTDQALALARAGLSSARERFRGGVGTQTDVLLALDDLNQSELQRVQAIVDYNKEIAALERAVLAKGVLGVEAASSPEQAAWPGP